MAAQQPAAPKATVKYTGKATRRVIRKAHVKNIEGVELEKDLEWNAANDFEVDAALIPEALAEKLRKDRNFKF